MALCVLTLLVSTFSLGYLPETVKADNLTIAQIQNCNDGSGEVSVVSTFITGLGAITNGVVTVGLGPAGGLTGAGDAAQGAVNNYYTYKINKCAKVTGDLTAHSGRTSFSVQGTQAIYSKADNLVVQVPTGYTGTEYIVETRDGSKASVAETKASLSDIGGGRYKISYDFYDNGNAQVTENHKYQMYMFIRPIGNASAPWQLLSLGTTNYVPDNTSVGSQGINVSLSGPYAPGKDAKITPTEGNVSVPLKVQLAGALADYLTPSGRYYVPLSSNIQLYKFNVIGPDGKAISLLKTQNSDGNNDLSPKYPVNSAEVITVPWSGKLVDGENKFSVEITAYIEKMTVGQKDIGSKVDPVTASYSFDYSTTTGAVTGTNSTDSATVTANNASAQEASATSTYDRCLGYFQGKGGIINWVEMVVVGKPICSLMQIIVTAASTLASYAINYFFKPALGLT